MNNRNASDFIRWIGLEFDYCGEINVKDLRPLLVRRLWEEKRNHDEGFEGAEYKGAQGCRVIEGGRMDGYLRMRTEELLRFCDAAGINATITWG